MALVRNGELIADPFTDISRSATIPPAGAVILSLGQWLDNLRTLVTRRDPFGIRLRSDEHPEVIADDLDHFAVIALEFSNGGDLHPCSHARLLREHWGYRGELRAVGRVPREALELIHQSGFDAFEIGSDDTLAASRTESEQSPIRYQPGCEYRTWEREGQGGPTPTRRHP
ncbi:MAG: DUF934 domain-containing protein [Gammaproteobacteria bacterium]|nr:DUF934 domain-containing protein [Gammaproteobacteria bacterium]